MSRFLDSFMAGTALLVLLQMTVPAQESQANEVLSHESSSKTLTLTILQPQPGIAYDVLDTLTLDNQFTWQLFMTGAVGQTVFCLPEPPVNAAFFKAVPHNRLVADITTDASTNPTTTQLVLSSNQNAFRVWTGEQDVAESYFDLFVNTNGVSLPPVRLYRWQSRIISAPGGTTVALGTVDGRKLSLAGMTVPASLETPAGVTHTAACDAAGPPLWAPSAPHVVLPAENMAFSIASSGSELPVFISEYDGARWTPTRFVILETNAAVTVRATFRYVALANFDGRPLTVIAPSNSVVGGVSQAMSLPGIPTNGSVWSCASADDFMRAVSNAVAGDQIVLADGTYAVPELTSKVCFNSNTSLGNTGPEGITIRSASGNPTNCILTGVGTNGGWNMYANGMATPAFIKGITFDFTGAAAGFWIKGGKWKLQDVRFTGVGPCNEDRDGNVNIIGVPDDPLQVDMLRVQCDHSDGMNYVLTGVQTAGYFYTNCWFNLVSCSGFTSGSNTLSDRVLFAGFGIPVNIYGGSFSDGQAELFRAGYGDAIHCFWVKLAEGSRSASLVNVSLFGCDFTTSQSTIQPQTNSYILFSSVNATFPYGVSTLMYAATDVQIVSHNRLRGNRGRALWSQIGGATYEGNILQGWSDGILAGYYSSGSTNPVLVTGNTFVSCAEAMDDRQGSFGVTAANNACLQSASSSLYLDDSATDLFLSDFNVYDSAVSPGFHAGANDILHASAALDARLRPTPAGNCDANGLEQGRVGDSDPWGQVLYYTPQASRGARARPLTTGLLVPDVW